MPDKTKIMPAGPEAIAGILINHFYTTQHERKGLVRDLLGGRHGHAIAMVLKHKAGRQRLGGELLRAFKLLAVWGSVFDCLEVYGNLPGTYAEERLILLERIISLGSNLVTDPACKKFFAGHSLAMAERRMLESVLGTGLTARLLRSEHDLPNIQVFVGGRA